MSQYSWRPRLHYLQEVVLGYRPGSWRSADLPSGWSRIREAVFARDGYRCQAILPDGGQCESPGPFECDHLGDPADHSLQALQTLCVSHHRRKTAADANAAMRSRRKEIDGRLRKPVERHTGMP